MDNVKERLIKAMSEKNDIAIKRIIKEVGLKEFRDLRHEIIREKIEQRRAKKD